MMNKVEVEGMEVYRERKQGITPAHTVMENVMTFQQWNVDKALELNTKCTAVLCELNGEREQKKSE